MKQYRPGVITARVKVERTHVSRCFIAPPSCREKKDLGFSSCTNIDIKTFAHGRRANWNTVESTNHPLPPGSGANCSHVQFTTPRTHNPCPRTHKATGDPPTNNASGHSRNNTTSHVAYGAYEPGPLMVGYPPDTADGWMST